MNRVVTTAVFAALVLGLTACQQTTTTAESPTSENNGFRSAEPEPVPEPTGGSIDDLGLGTIYFDYDRAEIRNDARTVLRKNAELLRSDGSNITVEGHCDNRGDEEYNLALGERRATSVRKYLVNLGVDAGQLRTISYGESKPAAVGTSEEAWQWNRRAEFVGR